MERDTSFSCWIDVSNSNHEEKYIRNKKALFPYKEELSSPFLFKPDCVNMFKSKEIEKENYITIASATTPTGAQFGIDFATMFNFLMQFMFFMMFFRIMNTMIESITRTVGAAASI